MTYAIQAEGLVKRFGSTTALAGVDLTVPEGTVLGVLGPNGAGKTTAVRILATLLRADEGHAEVGGFDVVRQANQVRRLIGLTGQYAAVDELMTGVENLVMVGRLLELPRRAAKSRAQELLARFSLSDAGDRVVKTYSGGMRRRLDLAASLVGDPRILYLDEPTTGLDPRSRGEVWDMIRELVDGGATVLLTTQYLDEADQLANEIAVVDHGRVVAQGTADTLKAQVGTQVLQVRPSDQRRLGEVGALLRRLSGSDPTRSAEGGTLSVPVTDPDLLTAAVRELAEVGITVAELTMRLPSLDEVFLTLTGHTADGEDEAPMDTSGTAADSTTHDESRAGV
jgi:oleandomycin transport system ATP-binding protein